MNEIEKRVSLIEERNKRVELDKKWEGSLTRVLTISAISYVFFGLTFQFIGADKPYVNALIAVLGFLLSTFSFSFIKKIWISKN